MYIYIYKNTSKLGWRPPQIAWAKLGDGHQIMNAVEKNIYNLLTCCMLKQIIFCEFLSRESLDRNRCQLIKKQWKNNLCQVNSSVERLHKMDHENVNDHKYQLFVDTLAKRKIHLNMILFQLNKTGHASNSLYCFKLYVKNDQIKYL